MTWNWEGEGQKPAYMASPGSRVGRYKKRCEPVWGRPLPLQDVPHPALGRHYRCRSFPSSFRRSMISSAMSSGTIP